MRYLGTMRTLPYILMHGAVRLAQQADVRSAVRTSMAALLVLILTPPAAAITKEYQVKLAYLYKFALYVTWPEGEAAQGPDTLVIGILGRDPFGPALERVAQKAPNGKRVLVKHFLNWDRYEPCDILFVSRGLEPETHARGVKKLKNQPVLIVGDSLGRDFDELVFDFYLDVENRVGIRMNVDAAERRRLRADARLLQVCDIVRDTAGGK